MGLRSIVSLVVVLGVGGSLTAMIGHRPGTEKPVSAVTRAKPAMAKRQLNPNYYEARRAAQVVFIYLNTRYGSPYKLFGLQTVYSATVEEVGDSGRKYQLKLSVQEIPTDATEKCSAEVFFQRGGKQSPPQVQVLGLKELLKIKTKAKEEALYQKYKAKDPLLSVQYLPDSQGNMDPDMEPFWYLCIAASSFIMLSESTENTLYNMAQVASLTQLPTENNQLKFDSLILLHDIVSQEIPRWKLLFTWSPAEGVKVLQMEQQPRRNG
ncbi:latexin isoform X2 [Austrofundulus limnaeus]|uniref:Latexin isoform X2 n=1 Tax=Austrofundulus limnaeus TaxID=52670 RepID=A0A2I4CYH7_AUSLI|nr:PREDICTED: latexin isoform X2 [Austrofundulus limnaeus]